MKVGVTGASGFIGRAFCQAAEQRGWQVVRLERRPETTALEGCDAVVHLAGESVNGRWTKAKKAEIERSRVEGTDALVSALAGLRQKPKVLVSASAVGYYGDRGDQVLDETSAPGNGFLAKVCVRWEASASRAAALGMRVVMLRTGVVIGRGGGALAKMMRPFRFGAGGPLGNGRQFVPWIHLDDMAQMYVFAIENTALSGPVNAVTPDYATSARVAQAIGAAMRRPSLAPAPSFALRAILGEFAQTVLGGQLVVPRVMQRAAFRWCYRRLEEAIQEIVDPSRPCTLLNRFDCRQVVNAPLEQVFAFFSNARNLEALTPPALRFSIRSAPAQVREGSIIDYRLRLRGVPLGWKTLISRWEPSSAFIDAQLHGPYALWEHVHTFRPVSGGVEIGDHVTYALPFAPLSRIAARFVRGDIERIFAYRSRIIADAFIRADDRCARAQTQSQEIDARLIHTRP